MRQRSVRFRSAGIYLCLCLGLLGLGAVQALAARRPITHDVYASWRSIQGTRLSRDGTWLIYTLVPQEGDGELVARDLKTDTEYRSPRGQAPTLAADGRHVLFTIAPAKADVDRAKKEKRKPEDQPKSGFGVMDLANGEVAAIPRVKSFKSPEDGGAFVAYLREGPSPPPAAAPAGGSTGDAPRPSRGTGGAAGSTEGQDAKPEAGSDMVCRDLRSGKETVVRDVVEYAWDKKGQWLAYAVSAKDGAQNGVSLWSPEDGMPRALLTGRERCKSLVFDEAGAQLAFLSKQEEKDAPAAAYRLCYAQVGTGTAREIASSATPGLPTGMVVSENGSLRFSKDGTLLFFATAPAPLPEPKDAPEPVKVDIWHWQDPVLQPMQKVQADREKKRSYPAVIHVKDGRFVQLAGGEMPDVAPIEGLANALGTSDVPYRRLASWDATYRDVYSVSLADGSRRRLLEKSRFDATLSPGGRYLLHFDAGSGAWFSQRLPGGPRVNLTGKLTVKFVDETWDTPDPPAPYGVAGWTRDDRSVLLYDRYDIWEVRPDGTGARKITQGTGRARQIIFRYQRLDPEERTIPDDRPLLLSATDDRTKATGFYQVALSGAAGPRQLVMLDKSFGGLMKARDAETLVFTLQRFDEFPDLWVSGSSFQHMRRISRANPQQSQYVWGRSELIDFRSADGKPLRAILTRPEDFDPTKKYPLMVEIYETLSDGLHRYIAPAPGTSVNITRYVSNGYVLLRPDIVYQTGHPGESALNCVLPAIRRVLDMGFIDRGRIGIQGHSWGGYQIAYLITRTDLFRAVEAGAAVANMTSAYGGIRWSSGMSRAFQYERTQSRIGAPPWERRDLYIENSPIFQVEKVHTPYLTLHNDADGAVPWYQGIEFFTALRRLGKEAYLFDYNGEDHGLRDRENQKHWTVHMAEFFDYYLNRAPKPEWMERGVPYLERGKRDLTAFYRSPTVPPSEQQTGALAASK